jgi:S-adenosylmethionine:tRNA ribosyltransferase-isomerase
MRTADFDYELPPDRIAQTPAEPRDAARLLVLDRAAGTLAHRAFWEIGAFLRPGDRLVVNETRVLRARLRGVLPGGGAAEVLLLRRLDAERWEALVRPGRRLRPGREIRFGPALAAVVEAVGEDGTRVLRFPPGADPEAAGETPLPPYIQAALADAERYQTVYGRTPGSAAAPTAATTAQPTKPVLSPSHRFKMTSSPRKKDRSVN